MSYSLADFCDDTGAILAQTNDRTGRERIRQKLELLLLNATFCAEYVGPDNESGARPIYQDPDLHFCVLTYNMTEPRTSPPHDHGRSWAIYGQAAGYTDMTVWSATQDNLEANRTFRLQPGQAGLFDVREIHSIEYPRGAKFVRITGVDMNRENRRVFDPETGAVREIEYVSAGSSAR